MLQGFSYIFVVILTNLIIAMDVVFIVHIFVGVFTILILVHMFVGVSVQFSSTYLWVFVWDLKATYLRGFSLSCYLVHIFVGVSVHCIIGWAQSFRLKATYQGHLSHKRCFQFYFVLVQGIHL